jgi:hypothetical protein
MAILLIVGPLLVGPLLVGCSEIKSATNPDFPPTEKDMDAKTLPPAPGKSLVYFYYGRKSQGKGLKVALDGLETTVDRGLFVRWEVSPGEHELQALFEKWLSKETFKTKIKTERDTIYYYRLHWSINTDYSDYDKNVYSFRETDAEKGREEVSRYTLAAWFQGSKVIYQRDFDPQPESTETVATMPVETTSEPESVPQTPPVPEAEPTPEAVATPVEATPLPATQVAQQAEATPLPETQMAQQPSEAGLDIAGRYYALVIGISDYESLEDLPSAVRDGQAVTDILHDYGFKVNTLFDQKATRERILDTLNVLQKLLEPEDKLLIYYAGHGYVDSDGQTAYWLPVDAQQENTTQWIIADTITASIKRIPASQILVVADSVYSGTLHRSGQVDVHSEASRRRYLAKMLEKPARVIITSGANQPVVMESNTELSLFAQAFVTALTDIERDVFTSEELFLGYIQETVAGQSEQLPELQIIRNSGHQGGDFIFQRQAME